MRRTLAVATALTAAVLLITGTGSPANRSGPPAGLTSYGRQLWNFEALLTQTYGTQPVCEHSTKLGIINFTHSACELSLAQAQPYVYVFAHAYGSSFRLIPRSTPPTINVAPLEIESKWVECQASPRMLFVEFSSGAWGCTKA